MMLLHPEGNFSAVAVLWQTSDRASLFSDFHVSLAFCKEIFFLFPPLHHLAESSLCHLPRLLVIQVCIAIIHWQVLVLPHSSDLLNEIAAGRCLQK